MSELTGIIVGHRSIEMPYVQELISMANAKKILECEKYDGWKK